MRIKPGYIYEDDPKSPNYIPLEKRLKTRYKHSPEEIEYPSYELIFQRLKDTYPILRNREGRVFTADTKYRVMIWLFYYSLLRCSELIERKRKDFETRTTKSGIEILRIHLPRKKKSNELAPKDEPFDIPLAFGGMDEVVEYLKTIKDPNERVFPFSTFVAWHRLKEVLPEYYPHYFRFAMLTELGSQPDMSINTMIQLSGLNINTIPKYLMKRDSDVDAELQSRLKRRT
jgi:hypothetical protein